MSDDLLQTIRSENLRVYEVSPQRLQEDVSQEHEIAQNYHGRLLFEMLQNADDAMAEHDTKADSVMFLLTDDELWVANSGRPLTEADVRGLCGISASSKIADGGKRRASIGHKGMGFKSVLEITESPEVYSNTFSFRFSPKMAVEAVRRLGTDRAAAAFNRAPVTRFPWPVDSHPDEWQRMQKLGMRTAFRFPIRANRSGDQRENLARSLRTLPVTTLLFLKHFEHIEFEIRRKTESSGWGWTIARESVAHASNGDASVQRVLLKPNGEGEPEEFLLAHDASIRIGEHRGGLSEYSWENVEFTEISVAARMVNGHPAPLEPSWRKLHVFLPSEEPCPYHLLVSGAFNSSLSRQEIRLGSGSDDYNLYLLSQVAKLTKNALVPTLLAQNVPVSSVLSLLNRGSNVGSESISAVAALLHEAVKSEFASFAFIPISSEGQLRTPAQCIVPPIFSDAAVGRDFRALLPEIVEFESRYLPIPELCNSEVASVLVDLGATPMAACETAVVLAQTESDLTLAFDDVERGVRVDPVLKVLERLWRGMDEAGRQELAEAVRGLPLFPVSIGERGVHRIETSKLACFYPPRSLKNEVPLNGLCFLASDIAWGALNPQERNIALKDEMDAWQALFGIREFKFPDVMRESVLPVLAEVDQESEVSQHKESLRSVEVLAAICQLSGRTPNRAAPLPYERLGSNRALFNLSRLEVPCRKSGDQDIRWMPAFRVYFGHAWVGERSIEHLLQEFEATDYESPDVYVLAEPELFAGKLDQYRHLAEIETTDDSQDDEEVGLDEDEETPLDADDQTRWLDFLTWLGVNVAMRPVHFHDVVDKPAGWLSTSQLQKPAGWAFARIPEEDWRSFRSSVLEALKQADQDRFSTRTPYLYQLHDLEHLVTVLNAAGSDANNNIGRALFEHLARNWDILEKFSRMQVAQIEAKQPGMRSKPPRAYGDELVEVHEDFWVRRLRHSSFCPSGHGPRRAAEVWLPTSEVYRRFGHRNKAGNWLPVLEVDQDVLKGKAKGFSQTVGIREELTPAVFSVDDAKIILDRLAEIYQASELTELSLKNELRDLIRPAYRNLLELLSSRQRSDDQRGLGAALASSPVLVFDGSDYRFRLASESFYIDRRDTRDRLPSDANVWTFVIEASPGARAPLTALFDMRILEDSLQWESDIEESSLDDQSLERFRQELINLAPYLLSRLAAERSEERIAREDVTRMRGFIERIETVKGLRLSCTLDGRQLSRQEEQRLSHVTLTNISVDSAFVVWGELSWPPSESEAEALATALCEVYSASYFESFFALIRAGSDEARMRLLRHAGAPVDIDEKREALLGTPEITREEAVSNTLSSTKTAPQGHSQEQAPQPPVLEGTNNGISSHVHRTPLHKLEDLELDGEPVIVLGKQIVQLEETHPSSRKATLKRSAVPEIHQQLSGYGGHTDLTVLNDLGMAISLKFELRRLQKHRPDATIFDETLDVEQANAVVFDVTNPANIERASEYSPRFKQILKLLVSNGISGEWPGFDILSLDVYKDEFPDRLIELKSSGVHSRIQEMSWNEWKVAGGRLRSHFYLYLVGNLRSDLGGSQPFIRTIQDPFQQLSAIVTEQRSAPKRVQLAVERFQQAEHLDLIILT